MQAFSVARVSRPKGGQGAFEPETGEEGGCAVTGTDDVQAGLLSLADETVGVSVDERETRTCSPMTKETRLDVVRGDVTFD